MAEINSIQDLQTDDDSLNGGTPRGDAVIEQSMQRCGTGRSVLADKNGKIMAGNHTVEKARQLGFDIETIHSDGRKLIVVIRDDLDLDTDAMARELAIADNRAAELNLDWKLNKLEEQRMRYAGLKTDYLFTTSELRKAAQRVGDALQEARAKRSHECPNCGHRFTE